MWEKKTSALFARRTGRTSRARRGTAATGIALLLLFAPAAASAELVLRFLDVGQGDATLIQTTGGCNVLVDAGRHDRNDVLNHLRAAGVERLDILVGTHPHADHIGQFPQVLTAFPVDLVWMSGWQHSTLTFEHTLDAIIASDVTYDEPRAGHTVSCGDASITVIHPVEPLTDIHDNLVLRVEYGVFSAMLTGDAEVKHEIEMLARGEAVAAQVLQLGHHGSRSSTSAGFLAAVAPQIAIYSAGRRNSFGHPHREVLERLEAQGIPTYGTDTFGTITIRTDGRSEISDLSVERTRLPEAEEALVGTVGDLTSRPRDTGNCVDLNTAPFERLIEIKHINVVRAEAIKQFRRTQDLAAVSDLIRIEGIGISRLRDIEQEGLACVR
jgi:competence protein ComEC